MEALYYVGGLVWLGRCIFGPPPKPGSDTTSDSPLGGDVGGKDPKVPGDGKPFITRAEQDAAKSDQQLADDKIVKTEGLDGLGTIADRNTGGG